MYIYTHTYLHTYIYICICTIHMIVDNIGKLFQTIMGLQHIHVVLRHVEALFRAFKGISGQLFALSSNSHCQSPSVSSIFEGGWITPRSYHDSSDDNIHWGKRTERCENQGFFFFFSEHDLQIVDVPHLYEFTGGYPLHITMAP